MKRAWIAFVVAASAAGCAEAPESPTTTTDTERLSAADAANTSKQVFARLLQATEAERSQRASQAGFVATVDAFAANDIVYSIAGQPLVRGKAAVAALLDSADPSHAQRATFEPRRITVSADGLLGATFGWNTFTTTIDGATQVTYGSYTTMWRRTGVRWTEIVHVANATATPPTTAPADFPLIDPTAPVVQLGWPEAIADDVATVDLEFAAASVATGGSVAIPAYAASTAAEAIYGGVFYGYDQVAASHANDYPPDVAVLDWWPSDQAATFTGDLGYTDGIYVVRLAGSDQVVAQGTYLTVYQRQPGGSWKFILSNSNPSPIAP